MQRATGRLRRAVKHEDTDATDRHEMKGLPGMAGGEVNPQHIPETVDPGLVSTLVSTERKYGRTPEPPPTTVKEKYGTER